MSTERVGNSPGHSMAREADRRASLKHEEPPSRMMPGGCGRSRSRRDSCGSLSEMDNIHLQSDREFEKWENFHPWSLHASTPFGTIEGKEQGHPYHHRHDPPEVDYEKKKGPSYSSYHGGALEFLRTQYFNGQGSRVFTVEEEVKSLSDQGTKSENRKAYSVQKLQFPHPTIQGDSSSSSLLHVDDYFCGYPKQYCPSCHCNSNMNISGPSFSCPDGYIPRAAPEYSVDESRSSSESENTMKSQRADTHPHFQSNPPIISGLHSRELQPCDETQYPIRGVAPPPPHEAHNYVRYAEGEVPHMGFGVCSGNHAHHGMYSNIVDPYRMHDDGQCYGCIHSSSSHQGQVPVQQRKHVLNYDYTGGGVSNLKALELRRHGSRHEEEGNARSTLVDRLFMEKRQSLFMRRTPNSRHPHFKRPRFSVNPWRNPEPTTATYVRPTSRHMNHSSRRQHHHGDDDESHEESKRDSPESGDFPNRVNTLFLKYVKKLNEDRQVQAEYRNTENAARLKCVVCGSRSEEFGCVESLATHAFVSAVPGKKPQHAGFHRALCFLMGWKTDATPDGEWCRSELLESESATLWHDLIIWPPVLIIHDHSIDAIDPTVLNAHLEALGLGTAARVLTPGSEPASAVLMFRGTLSGLDEAERVHSLYEERASAATATTTTAVAAAAAVATATTTTDAAPATASIVTVATPSTTTATTSTTVDVVATVATMTVMSNGPDPMTSVIGSSGLHGYLGLAFDLWKLDSVMRKTRVVRSRKEIRAIADATISSVERS